MPQPLLSILICTLTSRAELRAQLTRLLIPQCRNQPTEMLFEEDQGQMTIGAKRQKLLERATGRYVCFIDDDDLVSETYVADILAALRAKPDATHCSLKGLLVQPGRPDRWFVHSNYYKVWAEIGGIYVRPPNHLNAIRRDLALRAGFTAKSFGEDKDYSEKLVALGCLTNEAPVDNVLYWYRYTPKPQPPQPARAGRAVSGATKLVARGTVPHGVKPTVRVVQAKRRLG